MGFLLGIIHNLLDFQILEYHFIEQKSNAVLVFHHRWPLANVLMLLFDFVESLSLKHNVARSVGLVGQVPFALPYGILLSLLQ